METVTCEYCGEKILKSEATYYEDADIYCCPKCVEENFVVCERCGDMISYEDAHRGFDGYLCECCYDDLFG